jgi:hypothetical protein
MWRHSDNPNLHWSALWIWESTTHDEAKFLVLKNKKDGKYYVTPNKQVPESEDIGPYDEIEPAFALARIMNL